MAHTILLNVAADSDTDARDHAERVCAAAGDTPVTIVDPTLAARGRWAVRAELGDSASVSAIAANCGPDVGFCDLDGDHVDPDTPHPLNADGTWQLHCQGCGTYIDDVAGHPPAIDHLCDDCLELDT